MPDPWLGIDDYRLLMEKQNLMKALTSSGLKLRIFIVRTAEEVAEKLRRRERFGKGTTSIVP
jgi:hypothetical protein